MTDEELQQQIYFAYLNNANGFEGASREYRLANKGLNTKNPDEIASLERDFLVKRSQHVLRNNGIIDTAMQKNRENLNSVSIEWKNPNGKRNEEVQDWWEEFCEDPNLDGYGNFDNWQDGINCDVFRDGEHFTRTVIKKTSGKIPLKLHSIPSEYLDPGFSGVDPYKTRNGISFVNNRPVTYHFDQNITAVNFRQYGFISSGTTTLNKIEVPADEVIHVFDRKYGAGQWRGIPTTASTLLNTYGVDDLLDALTQKQIAAQFINWVVETSGMVASATGNVANVLETNTRNGFTEPKRIKIVEGGAGSTYYAPKGTSLKQTQSVGLGPEVLELLKFQQRIIAKASNTTYEKLTGDLSGVNMSSLQQLELELKTYAEFWYKFLLVPRAIMPVCNRFKQFVLVYSTKRNVDKVKPVIQYPVRYSVNALKDLQATILGMQAGLRLYSEEIAKLGITEEELLEDQKLQETVKKNFTMEAVNPSITDSMSTVKPPKANANSKSR